VEALTICFVVSLLLALTLGFVNAAAHSADQKQTDLDLTDEGRRSIDELLFQIRSAEAVLPARVIGSATYLTNPTSLVLTAPAYSARHAEYFLPASATR